MNNRMKIARDFANAINCDKIEKIILFGSVARGEDKKDSDIDILIISDNWEEIDDLISDAVFDVVLNKEELISPYLISNKQFDKTKHFSFLTNVMADGILIG